MNLWIRRVLGALPLVGCGMGMMLFLLNWQQVQQSVATAIIFAMFGLMYLFGAVAGVMLLQGHRHATTANFFYWASQTLQMMSIPLTYLFWTPVSVLVWWNISQSKSELGAQVGATFRLSMFNGDSDFRIGINLFAAACCVYLLLQYRREHALSVPMEAPVTRVPDGGLGALPAESDNLPS